MKALGIVFDMDGCLYQFDRGTAKTFEQSEFGREINSNVTKFFQSHFALSPKDAALCYLDFKTRFKGEVSLGLEQERGIMREDYFAKTWDLNPKKFMDRDEELISALEGVAIRCALLSAAPQIWIDKVLNHLGVAHLFEPNIFSGDPDIRKPDPRAFLRVAEAWDTAPTNLISIGDQEETDILPAKMVGMLTVRIGTGVSSQANFVASDVASAIRLLKKEGIL